MPEEVAAAAASDNVIVGVGGNSGCDDGGFLIFVGVVLFSSICYLYICVL